MRRSPGRPRVPLLRSLGSPPLARRWILPGSQLALQPLHRDARAQVEVGGGVVTTPTGSTGDARDPLYEVRQDAADLVASVRSLLGIDSAMAELDPAGFGEALGRLAMSVAGQPAAVSRSAMEYGMRSVQAALAATLRTVGLEREGPA